MNFDRAVVRFTGDFGEPKLTTAVNVEISSLGVCGEAIGGEDDGKQFFVPIARLALIVKEAS